MPLTIDQIKLKGIKLLAGSGHPKSLASYVDQGQVYR